jgi:transcriptional regulator with XRE-family HTH domain
MCRSTNAIDIAIGARMNARRRELGLGLETLAGALGISREQLERFEAGADRIGAALLARAATVLNVNVTYFFPTQSEPLADALDAALFADMMELNRVFVLIRDATARKTIIDLATMFAASNRTSGAPN